MKRRWINSLALLLALIVAVTVATPPAQAADKGPVTTQSSSALPQSAPAQLTSERKTPWYKSRTAKIVGGGAGAGAVVGALVGGGKGAAAGALVGGGAGYVYERKTRKK